MFDDSSLKIRLYIYTPLFFILGAFLGSRGWFWAGVLTWIAGGCIMVHILAVSVIRERTSYVETQREYYTKMIEFYDRVSRMTDEEKYIFGLSYTPKEVTVKKDKTADAGNQFSQTWRALPVAPYKLKVIAQAVLNGEGFTYRKWAGEGKLLTDPEWRTLHRSMVDLGMLEQVNEDDPRQGYNWTPFGQDVMTQVVKDNL